MARRMRGFLSIWNLNTRLLIRAEVVNFAPLRVQPHELLHALIDGDHCGFNKGNACTMNNVFFSSVEVRNGLQ